LASEFAQFLGMMVLLLGILVGSYWFVYAPTRRRERQQQEQHEGQRD
jgi:cbb3-type cytochrome oxidase subunit 3